MIHLALLVVAAAVLFFGLALFGPAMLRLGGALFASAIAIAIVGYVGSVLFT